MRERDQEGSGVGRAAGVKKAPLGTQVPSCWIEPEPREGDDLSGVPKLDPGPPPSSLSTSQDLREEVRKEKQSSTVGPDLA
jgi:hypothetical protein